MISGLWYILHKMIKCEKNEKMDVVTKKMQMHRPI